MNSLKEKGELQTLKFCNLNAQSLTLQKAMELKADVRRVSDKPRNLANEASSEEIAIIQNYKENRHKNLPLLPQAKETETKFIAYFPIETNEMCLKCHGEIGIDIKPEVYGKIKSLYPKDLAVGYKTNEIRGLFRVVLDK